MTDVINDILSMSDDEIAARTGMTPEMVCDARQRYQKIVAEAVSFVEAVITRIGRFNRGDHQLNILCRVPAHVLISVRDETIRLARGESDDGPYS